MDWIVDCFVPMMETALGRVEGRGGCSGLWCWIGLGREGVEAEVYSMHSWRNGTFSHCGSTAVSRVVEGE